jgi:hypothetical protein
LVQGNRQCLPKEMAQGVIAVDIADCCRGYLRGSAPRGDPLLPGWVIIYIHLLAEMPFYEAELAASDQTTGSHFQIFDWADLPGPMGS